MSSFFFLGGGPSKLLWKSRPLAFWRCGLSMSESKDLISCPKTTNSSKKRIYLVGGFNPFEKYARQIGSFPHFFLGEHKQYLSCHHLVESGGLWVYLRSFVWQEIMAKNRVMNSPQTDHVQVSLPSKQVPINLFSIPSREATELIAMEIGHSNPSTHRNIWHLWCPPKFNKCHLKRCHFKRKMVCQLAFFRGYSFVFRWVWVNGDLVAGFNPSEKY